MRVCYPPLSIDINLRENEVYVLCIEQENSFSNLVETVWNQCNGLPGEIRLSDNEKEYEITKEATCMINPYAIDFNERKILTKLYQELSSEAHSCSQEESIQIHSQILIFLERLCQSSPYPLTISPDLDISGLLKLYGIHIENDYSSLAERIIVYIRLLHQICKTQVLFAVNLKQYLNENDLQELYQAVFYEKVNLILIESSVKQTIKNEKTIIIDKDLCNIVLD